MLVTSVPVGDGEIGVGVRHLEHADRCGEHRHRHRHAEQRGARVAMFDITEYARHDLPRAEGGEVVVHRVLASGATGDVAASLGGHGLHRLRFEFAHGGGDARSCTAHACAVDRALYLWSEHRQRLSGGRASKPRMASMTARPAALYGVIASKCPSPTIVITRALSPRALAAVA